jgi:hypothetical protein
VDSVDDRSGEEESFRDRKACLLMVGSPFVSK